MTDTHQLLKFSTLLLLLFLFLGTLSVTTGHKTPDKHVTNTQLTSITDLNTLKNMLKDRIKYVKKNKSFINPVNCNKIAKLESLLEQASFDNLIAISVFLPSLGYIPIGPLDCKPVCNPRDSLLFQYEVGPGWYWICMTFPDQNSGFLFQLTHIDLLPRHLRKKKYNLGQSTLYQISTSVCIEGKAYRNPPYSTGGTYSIINDQTFSFVDTGNVISFSHAQGKMQVNFSLQMATTDPDTNINKYPSNGLVTVNCSIDTNKPYYPQGKQGCAPCIGGVGTMYFCYSQLLGSGSIAISSPAIMIPPSTLAISNGVGWMDHQWFGINSNSVLTKILLNALSGGSAGGGFGRYMWIPLHVSNDVQYLVTVIPIDPNIVVKVGDVFNTMWNKYSVQNITYSNKGKLTIMKTMPLNGVNYPCVVKIDDIEGQSYTVDGSDYGTSAIIDITGNDHLTQCANLLDSSGQIIGTSFIECMQFLPKVSFDDNTWKQAGSIELLGSWAAQQKNTSSFIISLLFLVAILILWIYLSTK